MAKIIEAATIGYRRDWAKWPDSQDKNYDSVLCQRQDWHLTVAGEPVTVRMRLYPVHRAYVMAGVFGLPVQHPYIVNTMQPVQSVLDAMILDLEALARDGVTLVIWEHAYQCYPPVAQHLRRLFRHSILVHGDDCPGSTEFKTMPIAKYFDTIFHGNLVWALTGEKTADLYKRMGVSDAHYLALSVTGGLPAGITDWTAPRGAPPAPAGDLIDLDWRIAQLRAGQYKYDLAFVGACAGQYRAQLNSQEFAAQCQAAGVRTCFRGTGMRDGMQHPVDISQLGRAVAGLYLDAFGVINMQMVSLAATRMYDAWACGNLLYQWDPFNEMALIGVTPNVHYAAYDGTLQNLISRVQYYKAHFDEAEVIIRAGHKRGAEVPREYNMAAALEQVITAHARKFWVS